MTTGRFYGLGLGPGDPELVTLKALRLLRAAAVVAYPAPESGDSFARDIVAEWLDQGQREIVDPLSDAAGAAAGRDLRNERRREFATIMDGGEDIAYLCQGDPLFYGSFAGILTRLAARYKVTVVPGRLVADRLRRRRRDAARAARRDPVGDPGQPARR